MRSKQFTVAVISSLLTAMPAAAQAVAAVPRGAQDYQGGSLPAQLPERISVAFDGTPLTEALMTVARRSGARVSFEETKLPAKKVTYRAEGVTPDVAFATILNGTGFRASRARTGMIEIVPLGSRKGSVGNGVISGKVTDAKTGKALSGVSISLGNDRRVTTDEYGSYKLTGVPAGVQSVSVRLVGYAKQSRSVNVDEGATTSADFKLEQSASVLDQVVVTGTVVSTELKAVPNAITVVTAKQIEERGIVRIDQLFRGDIPGLFAQNRGAESLADEVTMFSRGATAIPGSANSYTNTNPIKTYIDGIEMADAQYLSQIDPKSIERIEILTGPQASTIYGSNAINGVMQIFTKRGSASRPQLRLDLLSGWVENSFSSARTPQHDYTAQVNGIEGRLSYNAGGSWNYMGAWTPAKQTARTNVFGGTRLETSTPVGRVTADVNLRRSFTRNRARGGGQDEIYTNLQASGRLNISPWSALGIVDPTDLMIKGQTLGLTVSHTPASWWSHEFGVGVDESNYDQRFTGVGYSYLGDTTLRILQNNSTRKSERYAATARVPVTSLTQLTLTLGADAWQNLATSLEAYPPLKLTGQLANVSSRRQPDHNTGGFLQTQLGINDQLFLTYGLRAEWNPAYGEAVEPNYAPRYGAAYTRDLGSITAKLRASYGRSTRPPLPNLKIALPAPGWAVPYWGDYDSQMANPDLLPEQQQGWEGGVELYVGARGSLTVTRYNQTVDQLIASINGIDSVDFLPELRAEYGVGAWEPGWYLYKQQYLNVASIRNQGWELQGNVHLGPLTTTGTYSWTKSRTLGVNPKYRSFFATSGYAQYQPGASFQSLPEHTWALGLVYAHAVTTVSLNVTGTGLAMNQRDNFYLQNLATEIRLPQNRFNVNDNLRYVSFNSRYAMADVTASQRFTTRFEGVVQIQNLTDHYTNDHNAVFATIGRQVKLGARIR